MGGMGGLGWVKPDATAGDLDLNVNVDELTMDDGQWTIDRRMLHSSMDGYPR